MVLTTSGSKSVGELPPQAQTLAPKVTGKSGSASGKVVRRTVRSGKGGGRR